MTKKQKLIVEKYLGLFTDTCIGDTEVVHCRADELLLAAVRELGFGQLADAWEWVEREEGGFWYA